MLKIQKISWLLGLILLVLFHGNVFGSEDTGPVSIVGVGEVVNGNPVAYFYTESYTGSCGNNRWVLVIDSPAKKYAWTLLLSATFTGIDV